MGEEEEFGSFWDIGEPRRVLRRIENGHRACDDLMGMIQERADVELRYAKSLRQWAAKWDNSVIKGPEYGSVLTAWRTVLQEASAVAKIHEDCRMRLAGDTGPFYNVYKWKNSHFQRDGHGEFRQIREATEAFAAAQRDYAKLLLKVQRAKKAYYNASMTAYRARCFANDEASNPAVSPEVSWKLRQRTDGLALERERLKQVYLRRVMVCNATAKQRYVESMTSVFDRWQAFERKRLEHVQSQLLLFVRNLNAHSGSGISKVYQHIVDRVQRAEPARDVEEWGQKYGTGCSPNWPRYEEFDPRSHQTDPETLYEAQVHPRDRMLTTMDEMTDEFTTDDYDSEFDAARRHHRHPEHGRGPHVYRPYRSHQHEVHHFSWGERPRDIRQHVQQQQQHLPEPRFSQNEDLSERWLEERLGGRGRRPVDSGGRREVGSAPHKGHRKGVHHHFHHGDTTHHQDDTVSYADVPTGKTHHHRPADDLHRGQRSKEGFHVHEKNHTGPQSVHHHRKESSHYADDLIRSSGHHLSNHMYDTLTTSQSQESYIQGQPPSSTLLEQAGGGGYHRDYGYHGDSHSDDSLAFGQTGSSPEDESPHKDQLSLAPTASQTLGRTPSQTSSQIPAGASQPVPASRQQTPSVQIPAQTSTQTPQPTQGQSPTKTAAQTYIARWDPAEERAAQLEQARKALQPAAEGERLVRALYDFKPATRDEMALKQSEFVVQIGQHLSNGWAYGRKAGGERGHFPASYVQ